MLATAADPSRAPRDLGELCVALQAVDSQLDAVCELLRMASGGSKVDASSMHALLQPLRTRLSHACSDLADMQE